MSLVSTVPVAEAAATPVVSPILYDSGWKTVIGNGVDTFLETVTPDADGILHIYASAFKNTTAQYYRYHGPYSTTDGNATNTVAIVWRPTNKKSFIKSSGNLDHYTVYEASFGTAPVANQAVETRNCNGITLEKGTTFKFEQTQSANSSSHGIQYRVVVERSGGERMVEWATNA